MSPLLLMRTPQLCFLLVMYHTLRKRRAEVAIKNSAAVKQRWDTPTKIHGDIQTEIYTNTVTLSLAAAASYLRNSCLRCATPVFKNDLINITQGQ